MRYQKIEFRQVGWRGTLGLILAGALGLGLVATLILLSVGIAILLLPVIAIAALVGWFRWRKLVASAQEEAANQPNARVIETEYHVVDEDRDR